jgi:hypothetical protein
MAMSCAGYVKSSGDTTHIWKVLGLSSGPLPTIRTEAYHGTLVDKTLKYEVHFNSSFTKKINKKKLNSMV